MTSNQTENGSGERRATHIARGLDRGEIQAHFLPKVDLRSARVVGVEALARWIHPTRGVIPAGSFMELIADGGHQRALTEKVLEFSTRAAGDWWRSGLGPQLSLNLSLGPVAANSESPPARHRRAGGLRPPRRCPPVRGHRGRPARRPRDRRTAPRGSQRTWRHHLHRRLRHRPLLIAPAETLPLEELKLDRSLISGLDEEENRSIVRSTIHLAHQMGIQVVAEGVEPRPLGASSAAWAVRGRRAT